MSSTITPLTSNSSNSSGGLSRLSQSTDATDALQFFLVTKDLIIEVDEDKDEDKDEDDEDKDDEDDEDEDDLGSEEGSEEDSEDKGKGRPTAIEVSKEEWEFGAGQADVDMADPVPDFQHWPHCLCDVEDPKKDGPCVHLLIGAVQLWGNLYGDSPSRMQAG
ncbi:hypothetical protein GGX14DRAFT_404533 [Mycena pura]|uniref:Uncharacterized protein n=1 Tax=Mycena pura TaxID=153505 RepID=A0AAD6UTU9_9AGAR|nr:hypothetical protein GGX14DRAFT_404533 [Mycena pura]